VNTYLVKIFLKILRGGKCVCLETLKREWKEFQKGGGYHEGKYRYPNHIIQPLSKKFNRKASICQ
jgi:hypothetical protein